MAADVLIAFTTFPNSTAAEECVRRLVTRGLIACGNVLSGARSIYRWQGQVETSDEVVVIMKMRADHWPAVEAAVQEHHPYDVPELLAVPVSHGLAPYVAWVTGEEEDQ